jgi:integrase/recombinase XerC
VLGDYVSSLQTARLAPSSRAKYLSWVRGYLDWLAGADVEGDPLTEAAARDWAVRDYRDHLKRRRARPATINNVLAALDDFYRRGGLGPAQARREDIARRSAPRALDARQARRYLRIVERDAEPRDRVIALLPYYAGLRIGEVVALDVADVALSARKGELRVLGKGRDGGRERRLPIHLELRSALQAWLKERSSWAVAAHSPALVLNRRGGGLSDRGARSIITRLGEAAGLGADDEPFGPHVLRHTFATQLVRAGVDLVTVAELLGHARLDTTRIYSLPTAADRAAALEAILTDH